MRVYYELPVPGNLRGILAPCERVESPVDAEFVVHNEVLLGISSRRALRKRLDAIGNRYQGSGRRVIVFIVTDYCGVIGEYSDLVLFRTSLRRSLRQSNEYVLPYMWECRDEPFPALPAGEKPIVGFCGLASKHRRALLRAIRKHPDIEDNFIIRKRFWGGKPGDSRLQSEFFENIRDSHFTVCCRGAGNFSMRFYQTLSCGRIPILIDTDMILPFENEIDWRERVVLAGSVDLAVRMLLERWTRDDILAAQRMCREVFSTYLAKDCLMTTCLGLYPDFPNA